MVKRFNINNKNQLMNLLDFLKHQFAPDFYYTKDNKRIYIEKEKQLKELIKECKDIWVLEESGDTIGIIAVWASDGGEVKRDYIKICSKNYDTSDALLSVLLWNRTKETYIKIDKKAPMLNLFYRKGFKFLSGRGNQILLKRDKLIKKFYRSKNNKNYK